MYKKDDDSSQYVNVTVFVQKTFLTFVGEVFLVLMTKDTRERWNLNFLPESQNHPKIKTT